MPIETKKEAHKTLVFEEKNDNESMDKKLYVQYGCGIIHHYLWNWKMQDFKKLKNANSMIAKMSSLILLKILEDLETQLPSNVKNNKYKI